MKISADGLTLEKIVSYDIDINGQLKVAIPNSVKSIDKWAFDCCTRLTNITIPSSVTSIGYGAFQACISLTKITIPNSVTSIGDYAFNGCTNLTTITIESDDSNELQRIKSLLPPDLQEKVVSKQSQEAPQSTAKQLMTLAIQYPALTSAIAGLLAALAVVAIISTLGVAPALAAATGLSAAAATYTAATTAGVIACTATFFSIPSSISAHLAPQYKDDATEELGAQPAL